MLAHPGHRAPVGEPHQLALPRDPRAPEAQSGGRPAPACSVRTRCTQASSWLLWASWLSVLSAWRTVHCGCPGRTGEGETDAHAPGRIGGRGG
jgi:hypothetical protein